MPMHQVYRHNHYSIPVHLLQLSNFIVGQSVCFPRIQISSNISHAANASDRQLGAEQGKPGRPSVQVVGFAQPISLLYAPFFMYLCDVGARISSYSKAGTPGNVVVLL